jgi:hypothetical protein
MAFADLGSVADGNDSPVADRTLRKGFQRRRSIG